MIERNKERKERERKKEKEKERESVCVRERAKSFYPKCKRRMATETIERGQQRL